MQTSGLLKAGTQHESEESPGNVLQATSASIQDRLEVGLQQDAGTRNAIPQGAGEQQELADSNVSQEEAPPAAKMPHTASQRVRLVDQALKTQDMDNGVFLQNVRDRLDR